jgi:glycosyltransferase involved in cell wall biosynthesis
MLYYVENTNLNLENTIFYTYWFDSTTMGLALAKSKYPKIRVVSRAHRADLYEDAHIPPYIPFRQMNLERIDKVYAISNQGKNYISDRSRVPGDRIVTSRLGVDDPGFSTSYSRDGVLRIVSCSFLVPIKRVSLLSLGIRELADIRPDLRIEWNHLGDGPLKTELEAKARNLFNDSVKYHFYGRLPPGGIIKYYKDHNIDVFINVSKSEGIPVSIMEAQSCGIPVIATAVGGTSEIVNNENGILLNSNPTPIEIADALEKFSHSGEDILAKRKLSKFNWYSKYNAKINYNKFCDDLLTLQ